MSGIACPGEDVPSHVIAFIKVPFHLSTGALACLARLPWSAAADRIGGFEKSNGDSGSALAPFDELVLFGTQPRMTRNTRKGSGQVCSCVWCISRFLCRTRFPGG